MKKGFYKDVSTFSSEHIYYMFFEVSGQRAL